MPKPRTRLRIEDLLRIDARVLQRLGAFGTGACTSLRWTRGETVVGSAVVRQRDLGLDFTLELPPVPLTNIAYGRGTSAEAGMVLLCPACASSRRQLFVHAGAIGCRGCLGAVYTAQSVDALRRAELRAASIESLLDADGGRPASMSLARYRKLRKAWHDAEARRFEHAVLRLLGALTSELAEAIVNTLPELPTRAGIGDKQNTRQLKGGE